jgi:hypothetical protein
LILLITGNLSGPAVWLVVALAAYCVVPVRVILEGRRRGMGVPTPRGTTPLREPRSRLIEEPHTPERVRATPPPRQVERLSTSQRALFGLGAIAVLLLLGGILLVFGMARLNTSFGLALVGIGGFLMILSVTVPTFRLFDVLLRAVGRLIGRKTARG